MDPAGRGRRTPSPQVHRVRLKPDEYMEQNFPVAPGSQTLTSRRLEEFTLGARIGSGGFGNVYLSTENATGKEFAIKMVPKSHVLANDHVQQMMTERFVMALLKHDFVARCRGAFETEACLCYVVEYYPNGNLTGQLMNHVYFSDEVASFYTGEIVLALEYLQSFDIVHRDLKPDNILLDNHNHIKLTDFGACVINRPSSHNKRDEYGRLVYSSTGKRKRQKSKYFNSRVGTEAYLAPELQDRGEVTKSTDLWALGCIIFEFHSGKKAFEFGYNRSKRIRNACYKWKPPFPRNHDVEDLVDRILIVNPKIRLGYVDINQLKTHPFLAHLDWEYLHQMTPPPFARPLDLPPESVPEMMEWPDEFPDSISSITSTDNASMSLQRRLGVDTLNAVPDAPSDDDRDDDSPTDDDDDDVDSDVEESKRTRQGSLHQVPLRGVSQGGIHSALQGGRGRGKEGSQERQKSDQQCRPS